MLIRELIHTRPVEIEMRQRKELESNRMISASALRSHGTINAMEDQDNPA
jgi:hypothetical protein